MKRADADALVKRHGEHRVEARVGRPVSLRAVNLNLLPVLQALLRERSLVQASEALHLSRPAVSAALAQLRQVLGDPLLVRVGRTMTLTPRAEALIVVVQEACEAMRRVLEGPVFDPATTVRRFIIAASDYAPMLLGTELQAVLRAQAPGMSLHFVNQSARAFEALREGEIDFALAPLAALKALHWPPEHRTVLWSESHVLAVRRGHPLTRVEQVLAEDLLAWPRALLQPQWYPDPSGQDALMAGMPLGLAAHDASTIRVEQFCSLAFLAMQSDVVVSLPARILERAQAFLPLERIGPDPQAFEMAMGWGSLDHDDPAHRWLRQHVASFARTLFT